MKKTKTTNNSQILFEGGLCKGFYDLIKTPHFIFPMFISGILAWGWFICNTIVSIDGLSDDRYSYGVLLGQNRVTATIINRLLMFESTSFLSKALGILVLFCAIVFMCVVLKQIYMPKTIIPLTAFGCVYFTFPLLLEYFAFEGGVLSTGFCTLCVVLSLYYISTNSDVLKAVIVPSVLMALSVSWYEAFILPYIALTALILIVALRYKSISQKEIVFLGIKYAVPLVTGILLKVVVGFALMVSFGISQNTLADKGTYWLNGGSINDFFGSLLMFWFSKVFCYLPFTLAFIAIIVVVFLSINDTIKHKKPIFIPIYAILVLTVFAFSIYRCFSMTYRTEQAFPVLVASVLFLLLLGLENSSKKYAQIFAVCLTVAIVFAQCQASSYWANLEYSRYSEELCTAEIISAKISDDFTFEKPVVFIGEYELSEQITSKAFFDENSLSGKIYSAGMDLSSITVGEPFKRCDTLVRSYLNWGTTAFEEPGVEIGKFFRYHNYPITIGSAAQYEEAVQKYSDIPSYPDNGYIIDAGEYIVVNL